MGPYSTKTYRAQRAYWQAQVRAGGVNCVRCGLPIKPFQAMDLGHVDGDPWTIAGPEHRHSRDCPEGGNRAVVLHRKQRLASRKW